MAVNIKSTNVTLIGRNEAEIRKLWRGMLEDLDEQGATNWITGPVSIILDDDPIPSKEPKVVKGKE